MITRTAPGHAESWREYIGGPYRSDHEVIRTASRSALSVADYLEEQWGQPGRSRKIIGRLRELGGISATLETVCEIGPGSGGYIQSILEVASPERYEIYEIERNRATWLARTYPVVMLPTDGENLAGTGDESVQLLHAHGVFSHPGLSLRVISCFAYFREIVRVVAPGGYAFFDIICEACMSDDEVESWMKTPLRNVNFLSKSLVLQFFERYGFSLVGEFPFPLLVFGSSRYLVFRKL